MEWHQRITINGKVAWDGSSTFYDNGKSADYEGIEVILGVDIGMVVGESGFTQYVINTKVV